jgi:hypothetical protein
MRYLLVTAVALLLWLPAAAQEGVRGEPEAIAAAEAMVETMGGREIWGQLKSVHFVHEWYPWHRVDAYIENEVLDLTAPKSWVEMKSEVHFRVRAYSPEHGYWSVSDGEFSYGDEDRLARALERAPYSIYRIARAVAIGDDSYEIRFGFPGHAGSSSMGLTARCTVGSSSTREWSRSSGRPPSTATPLGR